MKLFGETRGLDGKGMPGWAVGDIILVMGICIDLRRKLRYIFPPNILLNDLAIYTCDPS